MNSAENAIRTDALKKLFFGLDTVYTLANGEKAKRIYLDSAASCLMFKPAHTGGLEFLKHYSNTHSETHHSAKISNASYQWAHEQVLGFLQAPAQSYCAIFAGSGSTAAFNRVARLLSQSRKEKKGVLVSMMEHHSNDLPHREHHEFFHHFPCVGEGKNSGSICLDTLEKLLRENEGNINYVAVTAASNVTGIINPIHDIAALAHRYGALIVVDASQYIAHQPLVVSDNGTQERSLDVVIFSGHKLYTPGSPGVLVIRKSLLAAGAPSEFGGGMVESVYTTDYTPMNAFPDREEAGTPNILGATMLAITMSYLQQMDMQSVADHETVLLHFLFSRLNNIGGITVYGDNTLDRCRRTSTLSFNLAGVDHELLALMLNDYFNIAVRNGCFCAHPYVRSMILKELWEADPDLPEEQIEAKKGMVRISFGLYNTFEDAAHLADALADIAGNVERYSANYVLTPAGKYQHKTFRPNPGEYFSPAAFTRQQFREQQFSEQQFSQQQFIQHQFDHAL